MTPRIGYLRGNRRTIVGVRDGTVVTRSSRARA